MGKVKTEDVAMRVCIRPQNSHDRPMSRHDWIWAWGEGANEMLLTLWRNACEQAGDKNFYWLGIVDGPEEQETNPWPGCKPIPVPDLVTKRRGPRIFHGVDLDVLGELSEHHGREYDPAKCAGCANAASATTCSTQTGACATDASCSACLACLDAGGDAADCGCNVLTPALNLAECLLTQCPSCVPDSEPPALVCSANDLADACAARMPGQTSCDSSAWCGPSPDGSSCTTANDCQSCGCTNGKCGGACTPYRGLCDAGHPPCCDGYVCVDGLGCQPPQSPGYCLGAKSVCGDDADCCSNACALDVATQQSRCL